MVCALLQPPAEVLPLFDHLLLLNEGQVSYFGPMAEAHSCNNDPFLHLIAINTNNNE